MKMKRALVTGVIVLTGLIGVAAPATAQASTIPKASTDVTPTLIQPATTLTTGGIADAYSLKYNGSTGLYTWKCHFSGWAKKTVDFVCELKDPETGIIAASHSADKLMGPDVTYDPTYSAPKRSDDELCTIADARYSDGTGHKTSQDCS